MDERIDIKTYFLLISMGFFDKLTCCFKKKEDDSGEPRIERHNESKSKNYPVIIFSDPEEVYSWHPHI